MSMTTNVEAHDSTLSVIEQAKSLGLVGASTLSVPMPFESKIVLFEAIRIAGTTHAPNIEDIMDEIPQDAQLVLVREPNNPTDQWAIRVEYNGRKIGYLPADKNELVARLMDGGKTIRGVLSETELQGSWWKVYMEVHLID